MAEIEINILGEVNDSKLGIKTSGERKEPLQAVVEEVTQDNLDLYKESIGIPTDERKTGIIEKITSGQSKYLVAKDPGTGEVAGYTSVATGNDNLLYIEVLPEYQGRKIGPQLIKSLQKRFNRLSLDNFIGSKGHEFYQSLGFKDEGMPGHMVWEKANEK